MASSIENEIIINNYISFNSYNFEKENSRCYITNERLHTDFLLEDISADLWNVLVTSNGNMQEIETYATKYNAQDSLDDFLDELFYFDLISFRNNNIEENNLSDGVIKTNRDFSNQFLNEKKLFLLQNNFLYSLEIEIPKEKQSIETLKNIIDNAIEIGVSQITIKNNEELLDDNFFEIAEYIRHKHISLNLKTNGLTLHNTPNVIERLNELFLHRIIIPLYSTNDDINYKITSKKDLYKNSLEVIQGLAQNSNIINIFYEQKEENKNSFEEIYEFIKLYELELSCCKKTLEDGNINIINLFNDDYLENAEKSKQKLFVSPTLCVFEDEKYTIEINEKTIHI